MRPSLENGFNPGFGNNLPWVGLAAVCESFSCGFQVVHLGASSINTQWGEAELCMPPTLCHGWQVGLCNVSMRDVWACALSPSHFSEGEQKSPSLLGSSPQVSLLPRSVGLIGVSVICVWGGLSSWTIPLKMFIVEKTSIALKRNVTSVSDDNVIITT